MKKATKKLTLSKETITKLNLENMNQLRGGNTGAAGGGAGSAQASLSAGTAIPTCAG